MDLVRIFVLYDVEWINQINKHKFNPLATKRIMVHPSSTYSQLLENITQTIEIGISKYEIIMKFKCNSTNLVPLVEIISDDDMQFLLHENLNGIAYRKPS